jgi:hypothetical protein
MKLGSERTFRMVHSMEFDLVAAKQTAKRLNNRANFITIAYFLMGLVIGGFIGFVIPASFMRELGWVTGFFGATIGAMIGTEIGQGKALEYRWQCHMLVTALQIEANTNRVVMHTKDTADFLYVEKDLGDSHESHENED